MVPIKLQDLELYLNQLLPDKGLIDYCPNGLQVEGKPFITRFATAVSASLLTIETAVEQGIEALIVHHGLFWERESAVIRGTKRQKLALLLAHDISLFSYHLPLDIHPSIGNNWKAAQDLGWTEQEPFGLVKGIPLGVKGRIPATSREEVKKQLEEYYGHSATCAWGGSNSIETLALVSGGAHKMLKEAKEAGVDAFITGSFDEPIWHQAFEEKINFFALGHSATERIGPQALAKYLTETFDRPCLFLDISNPF